MKFLQGLMAMVATIATLGVTSAQADVYSFSAGGFFTMVTPTGGVLANPDAAGAPGGDAFGVQTPLSGMSLSFDTATGQGTGSVAPFVFSGTLATAHDISMQAIGDGTGGPGTLIMGSMLFDYGPTLNIPVYLVANGAGIFGAIQGGVGIGDPVTGGVVSSTDAAVNASPFGAFVADMGAIPFAMTSLDVNQDGDLGNLCGTTGGTGALIGGGFPLCDDSVSGIRMATAPFPGHQANFDITSMTVTNIEGTVVPEPGSMLLIGSSLIGLVGLRRRLMA
jgi:hypothetical protein